MEGVGVGGMEGCYGGGDAKVYLRGISAAWQVWGLEFDPPKKPGGMGFHGRECQNCLGHHELGERQSCTYPLAGSAAEVQMNSASNPAEGIDSTNTLILHC